MSSQRPSILASSKWVFIGTAAAKPMQLIGNVLLAHFLGPLGMGTFGLASSAAVTLSGIIGLGLGDAANKLLAEHYRRDPTKGREFGSTIVWFAAFNSFVLMFTLWMFQSYWHHLIFPENQPKAVLALVLCLAWVNILASLSTAIFNGIQHFRSISLLSACQALICVLLATPFAYFGGAAGALLGYVLSSFVYVVLAGARLYKIDNLFFRYPASGISSHLKDAISCSAPFWLSALVIGPITTLSFAFLAKQVDGQSELGVYNTANALKMLVATLPGIIGPVLMSAIIEEGGVRGNQSEYSQLFRRSLIAITFLSIPVLVITSFASEVLFSIYGQGYGRAAGMFQYLSAAIALGLISSVSQFALIAKGKVWSSFFLGSFQQVIQYIFTLAFVPIHLGIGLSWANFLSSLLGAVMFFECSFFFGAISSGFRRMYYGSVGLIILILACSTTVPVYPRTLLAAPATILFIVLFLHRYVELRYWLASLVPLQFLKRLKWLKNKILKGCAFT